MSTVHKRQFLAYKTDKGKWSKSATRWAHARKDRAWRIRFKKK